MVVQVTLQSTSLFRNPFPHQGGTWHNQQDNVTREWWPMSCWFENINCKFTTSITEDNCRVQVLSANRSRPNGPDYRSIAFTTKVSRIGSARRSASAYLVFCSLQEATIFIMVDYHSPTSYPFEFGWVIAVNHLHHIFSKHLNARMKSMSCRKLRTVTIKDVYY